ncbi:hypothetical protein HYN48_05050 [Flavobacterium magnum]|uniref:NodB homology domain-containing protein n=1 Tax=Flavobacterium magnum TaxID=2162713 RepID=A0A2S0RD16_9FLAO|nr:polysaccharide deacetylase family protein [Flavobacterium magnum]AWA29505.1 hypothetical protein HYN48_05050 [Flavobacterium magnum]
MQTNQLLLMRIKYRLKLLLRSLGFRIGLGKRWLENRYGERILVFHGIDTVGETRFNSRYLSQDYFEELLCYFSRHFNILSLEDFYAGKFREGVLNIALTFDDGLQNNFQLAIPLLKKYRIPATFFITVPTEQDFIWPDFLDLVSFYTDKKEVRFRDKIWRLNRKREFVSGGITLKNYCRTLEHEAIKPLYGIFSEEWKQISPGHTLYWKLLSADQIRDISNNDLFTIGGHGVNHSSLIHVSPVSVANEIVTGKATLEQITGKPVDDFAFPFGDYNDEAAGIAISAGYSRLLLVDKLKNQSAHGAMRERFVVNPYISKKHFIACLLKGSYR